MKDINELLERYYNAETTAEEEKIIEAYFASGSAPEHSADDMLFSDKKAYQQYAPQKASKGSRSIRLFTITASAAAAVLLCIALFRGKSIQNETRLHEGIAAQILIEKPLKGEIVNEQQALEQARKALAYVSEQLNKGTNGVSQLDKLGSSLSKIQNEQL